MFLQATHDEASRAIRVQLAYHSRSQRWLAESIGMTPHQLSRRMTGKVAFTTDDIDDIADVFDISVEKLFAYGDQSQPHCPKFSGR